MRSGNPHPVCKFPKGKSGNPAGRPKGSGIRQWIKIIAEQIDPKSGETNGRILAGHLWRMAKQGHSKAIDVIVDGCDGKLTQSLQIEPINIHVTYSSDESDEKEDGEK